MSSDINKIDLSLLSSIKDEFNDEKNKFNYNSYNTFKSSYINKCNDPNILKLKSKLETMYKKISNGYENVYDWFNEYIKTASSLENSLANDSNSVSEPQLNSFVSSKLMNLPDMVLLDNMFQSNKNTNSNFNSDVSKMESLKNDSMNTINKIVAFPSSLYEKINCTVASFATSTVEGLMKFGNKIYTELYIGADDLVRKSFLKKGLITKEQSEQGKRELQKEALYRYNYWKNIYDDMYNNTKIGNYLKSNTVAFDLTRNVGNITGEVGGTIIIGKYLGNGGAAAVSGLSGGGQATVEAWANGATYDEGMRAGIKKGAWDASQWVIAGQLGSSGKIAEYSKTLKDGILKSGAKVLSKTSTVVALDTLSGAAETFVDVGIKKGYSDKSFKELYKEAGGTTSVVANTLFAGIASGGSEILSKLKINKNQIDSGMAEVSNSNVNGIELNSGQEINKTLNMKNLENNKISFEDVIKRHNDLVDEIKLADANINQGIIETLKKQNLSINNENVSKIMKYINSGNYDVITGQNNWRNVVKDSMEYKKQIATQKSQLEKIINNIIDKNSFNNKFEEIKKNVNEKSYLDRRKKLEKQIEILDKINILKIYDKEIKKIELQIKLLDDEVSIKSKKNLDKINNYFESLDIDGENRYGVDQGIVNQTYEFYPDGEKIANDEYFELKDKMVEKYGFSNREASIFISGIDNDGACTYAATANSIISYYLDKPSQFEKDFGYSMFRSINGATTINSSELLADIYYFANHTDNGGILITKDINGKAKLTDSACNSYPNKRTGSVLNASNQIYLTKGAGKQKDIIDKFLKSKNKNLNYNYNKISIHMNVKGNRVLSDSQINKLINDIKYEIASNNSVELGIIDLDDNPSKIIMKNLSGGEDYIFNIGTGHATYVTGVNNDGLEVSSWGRKFLITFDDLKKGSFSLFSNVIKMEGN